MKTTAQEKTIRTIRKTGLASKMAKTPLKTLSMKPVRSMKRLSSVKVRPALTSLAEKEVL